MYVLFTEMVMKVLVDTLNNVFLLSKSTVNCIYTWQSWPYCRMWHNHTESGVWKSN